MKNQNKTFIIFSPAFPANETENWLPSLQSFVRSVNKNFPELNLIVFTFQYPYATKIYLWNKNMIIPFNGMHKNRMGRLLMWMKIFYKVRKIKKQDDIVGIFSQWCGECTFVAKYVSKFLRLKYFCWILGQDARKTNTYVKRICPKASSLIAISDFLVDEFYRSHGIKPQHIIPIGIDTELFGLEPVGKDIDLIGVGSLSFIKQYDLFVEIIAALKNDLPHICATLCGDGEARDQIEVMIKEFSLNKALTVTGLLGHIEALQMMQRAKILLHPSSYEGFGIVCLEALYAGAHVISFVQPMYRDIKNWHIVKTKEEMAEKALELLRNPHTKYESVLAYTNEEAVKKILKSFGYA
jgi:glycosyltransferase involved in cell wall biosynthesis